jgi:hypothetical protein
MEPSLELFDGLISVEFPREINTYPIFLTVLVKIFL